MVREMDGTVDFNWFPLLILGYVDENCERIRARVAVFKIVWDFTDLGSDVSFV